MSKQFDINRILETLENVLPKQKIRQGTCPSVPLHEPLFIGREWDYVKECLDTGWVSSVGPFVDRLEGKLVEFTGIRHAVAVVNGTSALHIALKLVGVRENDEVLLPALTFIATANAVTYCGAVPHFVDSEERTLGLDPYKLENYLVEIAEIRGEACINKRTGRRVKAVVPMHTFGHPVDMDPLIEVCGRYKLELVEDAAESLGSYYKGAHTGSLGRVAAVSFNGNKIVTTGGGGAILTNDERLAKRAKHLTTTAKIPHPWAFIHDDIGYNYRMPNLNAALGCAQMEQLPDFIERKRRLAEQYQRAFHNIEGVQLCIETEFARSNYWLNGLLLDRKYASARDHLLEVSNKKGIRTRPAWTLLHKLNIYDVMPRMDLTVAEDLESRLIALPSSPGLVESL